MTIQEKEKSECSKYGRGHKLPYEKKVIRTIAELEPQIRQLETLYIEAFEAGKKDDFLKKSFIVKKQVSQ